MLCMLPTLTTSGNPQKHQKFNTGDTAYITIRNMLLPTSVDFIGVHIQQASLKDGIWEYQIRAKAGDWPEICLVVIEEELNQWDAEARGQVPRSRRLAGNIWVYD